MDYNNHLDKGDDHRKAMSKRVVESFRKRKKENPIAHILWRCRDSANKKGYEYDLSPEDIFVPEKCPLLGITLTYDDYWSTPSIDRRDQNKGYIKGNVWIISRKANVMKQDVSIDLLKLFANNILLNF